MDRPLDCIVCGNLVADIIGRPVDALVPKHNTGHTRLEQIRLFTGGFANNVSVDLAKLGVRTGVIGRVGDDEWREVIARTLGRHGVETSELITDPAEQTSATIVCVDSTGERSFYHTIGAQKNLSARDVLDRAPYLRRAKVFALGYYGLLPAMEKDWPTMLKRLRTEYSLKILVDTCGSVKPTLPDLARSLPFVDFFIPSYHEAKILTGRTEPEDMVKAFRECGSPGILGIKLGGDGCLLDDGSRRVRVPAFPVERVVDTTGAGDSFLAGIITACLHGMNLEQMARFANAVGSCCVQALGASSGIRSFQETMRILESGQPSPIPT